MTPLATKILNSLARFKDLLSVTSVLEQDYKLTRNINITYTCLSIKDPVSVLDFDDPKEASFHFCYLWC